MYLEILKLSKHYDYQKIQKNIRDNKNLKILIKILNQKAQCNILKMQGAFLCYMIYDEN